MNAVQLHLWLNHIPIVGAFFGLCLLAYGVFAKNISIERAGLITLILISLAAIPAFLTGEEAEEAVERLPGVSGHYIEEHEHLAETALWVMISTGILSLFALALSFLKKKIARPVALAALLGAMVSFGIMVQAGNHGGKIRHSEIRTESVAQPSHDDD
jgi:hypothetical protein